MGGVPREMEGGRGMERSGGDVRGASSGDGDVGVHPTDIGGGGVPKGSLTPLCPPREHLPSHFKFKEYCPQVFRNLRERFGIDDQDYQVGSTPHPYLPFRCPPHTPPQAMTATPPTPSFTPSGVADAQPPPR